MRCARGSLRAVGAGSGLLLALWAATLWASVSPESDGGPERYFGQRLVEVAWIGNDRVPAASLAQACGWSEGALLDASLWNKLATRVREAYSPLGYLDCRILDVGLSPADGGVRARVRLHEGPRYRLGDISIDGVSGAEAARILRELEIEPGAEWSSSRLEAGIARVLDRYAATGRPFTQMRLRRISLEDGLAELGFLVVEGDTVRVDTVRVEGLRQTRTQLVNRVVGPLIGRPYDPGSVEDARAALLSLGIFSRVGEGRLLLTAPGRGELVYEVEEGANNAFEGAFGYQGEGQSALGYARLHVGNLAGTARQADVVWEGRGQGVSYFDLRYGEPYVAGLPVRADLHFSQELQGEAYTRTAAGLSATLVWGRGSRASLGVEAGRVVVGAGPVSHSSRWGVHLAWSRGSSPPLSAPGAFRADGYRVGLLAGMDFLTETLREGGADDARLATVGLDAGVTRPAGAGRFLSLVFETRARYSAESAIAVYDLYPVGGVRSLRGYREDAFRAARLAILRAEYGLVFSRSRLFLFLDQAVFHRSRPAPDSTGSPETRYRAGYGLGTSYPSPIGELALLLGWGEGTGPLDAKLHVQLMSRF